MDFTILLENVLTSIFGDITLAAILIIILFTVLFIIIGLNVRFAIMATMPLGLAFSEIGWLDLWVGGAYWIFIIGFSLYTIWTLLQSEYF